MLKKHKGRGKKVVVLGIDGAPYSLLQRFAAEGLMPNFARLIQLGTFCSMTASIPEVSSTSWSTFMTGVNPGRHGIYGFMELQKADYSWKFPNFNDLKSKTLWDLAGEHGKKSIVINIPSTYPARPLHGMMVSGFVALDLRKASYPDSLYNYLNGAGYRLDVDATKAVSAVNDFTKDIQETYDKRIEIIQYLYDKEEWDMFIAVVTETDRMHHYLWAALDDKSHPQHAFFQEFYHKLDKFIGAMSHKIDDDSSFIMLSDHGFTLIKKEVYLNAFFREKGYLKFTKHQPESFADIDGSSQAFALDPSRIYLHMQGKYPRGCVSVRSYEGLRTAIKDDLFGLTVNGHKVIKDVLYKEDIYVGDHADEAPDIVVLPHEGYDLKGSIRNNEISGNGPLTGSHTQDNAFFYVNRKTACHNTNIADAGVTVLNLLGVANETLEGKSLC